MPFLMLYGTAVAGMLFVWLIILNTHLRFRKTVTAERISRLPMRLRAHPFFTLVGIALLLAISVTTFFVDGLQWSFPAFAVFLAIISLLYLRNRRRKESTQMTEACDEVYSSLHRGFKGDLLRPGQSGYEDARGIWNGMFNRTPGLIARCADVKDVQSAVRAASQIGLLTAIRCGGHSLAGFSTCDGGLVIDLSKMKQVTVDPGARRARFAGGCLLGSIDTATQKARFGFPFRRCLPYRSSGLVLGGGTGWLTRRFGLSCDNVEGFSLVAADGSIVRANAKENPDLFWALRGGGGNFGVVTEFQVKLHPLSSVVLAEGLTGEAGIRPLLELWRDFMAEAPLDLKWNINLRLAPHTHNVPAGLRGRAVASNSLVWTGDPEAGRQYLERALAMCDADSVTSTSRLFPELTNHGRF